MLTTQLTYFVKIAETGSFTAAARTLRVSQPSLSVAVKRLEEELDTTLFVRTRKGVALTRTGEVLLREARQAARTLTHAREEIQSLEDEPRGRFTLGIHESLGAYFLPGFMAPFLERYPRVELALWNGNSRDVQRAVVEREIDLGVVVNAERHPDCVIHKLFDDRFELVASSTLRARESNAHALIKKSSLVFVPALKQSQVILHELEDAGVRPASQLTCSSMELVKSLVLEDVGVGLLPYRVATYRVPDGRLVRIDAKLPHFDDAISLVRRYDMHDTHAARTLLDALKTHGAAMPPVAPERRKKKLG